MPEVVTNLVIQTGLPILIVCVLIAAGFYLVSSFRDYADRDQESTPDALANLLEMHRKGDISDEEFRIIEAKTRLPPIEPTSPASESNDESTSQDDASNPFRPPRGGS